MQLLIKCCFCPNFFTIDAVEYRYEKRYTLQCNVICPKCHTRIVAGKNLEVMPMDEEHAEIMKVSGRWVRIKIFQRRDINIFQLSPEKSTPLMQEVIVPRKILYPGIGSAYVVELPDGGTQAIHDAMIMEWMPEGWEPESLGPVIQAEW